MKLSRSVLAVAAAIAGLTTTAWAVDHIESVPQSSSFRATLTFTDYNDTPIAPPQVTYAVFQKGHTSTPTYGPITITDNDESSVVIDVPDSAVRVIQPLAAAASVMYVFTWRWTLPNGLPGERWVEFPVVRNPYRSAFPTPIP